MKGSHGFGLMLVGVSLVAMVWPWVWAPPAVAGRRPLSPLAMRLTVGSDVLCEHDGGPCTAACYDPYATSGCWAIFSQGPGFDNECDARGCSSGHCGSPVVQYAQNFFYVPVTMVSSFTRQTEFEEVPCFRYIECITGPELFAACINRECQEPTLYNYICTYCTSGSGGPWITEWKPVEFPCDPYQR